MIDIIEQLVGIGRACAGECLRAYPPIVQKGKTYCVVTPQGRSVVLTDEDGEEIATRLVYGYSIFAPTVGEVDDIFRNITAKLNKLKIQSNGYSPAYSIDNMMYTASATYTCMVDVRGNVYK